MSEFLKRSLTGAVFISVMLGAILWNQWSLFLLLITISTIALFEFYSIFRIRKYSPLQTGGIISGIIILSLVILERQSILPLKYLLLIMVPILGIWFSFILLRRTDMISSLIITISGLIYILLPLSLILLYRGIHQRNFAGKA